MSKYCVDVFVSEKQPWMREAKKVNGKHGVYYTITTEKKNEVIRQCRRRHLKYRWYESCWARSNDYRKNFLDATSGPYICVYCGRPLSVPVVDHIIPVEQAKKSPRARRKLKRQGINNVNDIRNLAPACAKCNNRKGDRMWVFRARRGMKKWNKGS